MSRMFRDNGWIKSFVDKTNLVGLDKDVPSGKCSWRRSRLEGMTSCVLNHGHKMIAIQGDGEYWQSDTLSAVMSIGVTNEPVWQVRRLQRKIDQRDLFIIAQQSFNKLTIDVKQHPYDVRKLHTTHTSQLVKAEDIGKWITVTIDVQRGNLDWHLSEERI